MTVLTAYIIAYDVRLYIMNYFKNTRSFAATLDNRGVFAIEQVVASLTSTLFDGVGCAFGISSHSGQLSPYR